MSRSIFSEAKRSEKPLKLTIDGPSGSGKTFTSLTIAHGLLREGSDPFNSIALIETEHGRSKLYASGKPYRFQIAEIPDGNPEKLLEFIEGAENEGFQVLIIDSLSNFWQDRPMALMNQLQNRKNPAKGDPTGFGWLTPLQNKIVDAIMSSPLHIIATLRVKAEYSYEDKKVTKIGMAVKQREGLDYEFDINTSMDMNHSITITKASGLIDPEYGPLQDMFVQKPSKDLGRAFLRALEDVNDVYWQVQEIVGDNNESQAKFVKMLDEALGLNQFNGEMIEEYLTNLCAYYRWLDTAINATRLKIPSLPIKEDKYGKAIELIMKFKPVEKE